MLAQVPKLQRTYEIHKKILTSGEACMLFFFKLFFFGGEVFGYILSCTAKSEFIFHRYESSLLKMEAIDSTQVKVLLDAKNSQSEATQSYHNEILSAVERLEKEKEADRQIWQAKIKVKCRVYAKIFGPKPLIL